MSRGARESHRRRIVIAGSIFVDLLTVIDRVPPHGETVFVDQIHMEPGGLGANVAACAARLGADVALVGRIGRDAFGESVAERLQRAGVDCRWLQTDLARPTGMSLGLISSDAERSFIVSRGANLGLSARNLAPVAWTGVTAFHLGGLFHFPRLESSLPRLLGAIRSRGISTSLDLAWGPDANWMRTFAPIAPTLDWVFPNRAQLERLAGASDVPRATRVLREYGVAAVAAKLGAAGCYVDSPEWTGYVRPPRTRAVDTTGAGDAFVGAFLVARQRGWQPEQCAQFACIVGAASVRAYGGVRGLPTFGTAMRTMARQYGHAAAARELIGASPVAAGAHRP